MRIRPTGAELVPTAQAVLRENIAPEIPAQGQSARRDVEAALALAAHLLERDGPASGEELDRLESARARLRTEMLGLLPSKRHYDARLVAKVLAIATNQLADGSASERFEADRLASLVGEMPQIDGAPPGIRRRLTSMYARLCADIRAGRADPGTAQHAPTHAHLWEITRQAVSESNPAYVRGVSRRDVI